MLLDSNVIIYASNPKNIHLREYLGKYEKVLCVSTISKLEVLGYHKLKLNEKQYFEKFFAEIIVLPIDNSIIDKAILLRQQKNISVGDSIIAATAIIANISLLTHNEVDFKAIKKLEILPIKNLL